MNKNKVLLILIILCRSLLHAQTISNSDKVFIDSLLTTKTTVFIIDEYCLGCGNNIRDRTQPKQALSCIYNDSYYIIWWDKDSEKVKTKITDTCYELFATNTPENSNFDKLNLLFNDSTTIETWLKPTQLDSTDQSPIKASTFYKITKLVGIQEFTIQFNENLLLKNPDIENTNSKAFLVNELMNGFYKELARLTKEGKRITTNWH